jgi:hypothetical protein
MQMNPYYLIYYWIYKATRNTNKDVVEWTSMVTLSALTFFNLITLMVIIFPHFLRQVGNKVSFVSLAIAIMILNYFVFIYKSKYQKIFHGYSNKKVINNFMIGLIILTYIIGSVYFMIYFLRRMPVN